MIATDANDVFGVFDPTAAEMSRLRGALADRAAQDDLLDVAYRTIDSPVGPLLLAATPLGLVQVAFATQDHDAILAKLTARVSPRVLHAPARLDPVARELDEYFAGRRRSFDVPLDFQLSHGFRRAVQLHLREIAYGHTESYAEVATAAGSPAAVRAVGSACATNPLPVIVPCHRVVRSDGTQGGYVGGADAKRGLLAMEASGVRA